MLGRDPGPSPISSCGIVSFADVAVLPRWVRVSQARDYVAGAVAAALKPMHERQGFGRSILLFDALQRTTKRLRFTSYYHNMQPGGCLI